EPSKGRGVSARNHEGGLGQVVLRRDLLHDPVGQPRRQNHHRGGISPEALGGEGVHLVHRKVHGSKFPGSRVRFMSGPVTMTPAGAPFKGGRGSAKMPRRCFVAVRVQEEIMKLQVVFTIALLGSALHPSAPCAEDAVKGAPAAPAQRIFLPNEIAWVDALPGLPRKTKVAVLHGDPKAEGPFAMRVLIPAGYSIQPHFHPADENVTVI